jgi:hypothetical protein
MSITFWGLSKDFHASLCLVGLTSRLQPLYLLIGVAIIVLATFLGELEFRRYA